MILEAETALLIAVRRILMEQLSIVADSIDIEIDDLAPAMTGNTYYCLSPAGGTVGKYTATADQTTHNIFGVRVAVIMKITEIPRDRRRNSAFLDRLSSINGLLSAVSRVLRFNYVVLDYANAELELTAINGQFKKPLVPQSIDQKPKMVASDIYNAKSTNTGGDTMVAMVRGINFGGAEFFGIASDE